MKFAIYNQKALLNSPFELRSHDTKLPRKIRDMHSVVSTLTAEGQADVDRGVNLLSRIIGWLFKFPQPGRNLPVKVQFNSEGRRETWVRHFGTRSFSSRQTEGAGRSDKLVEEKFGAFTFGLALVASQERLSFVVRRWNFLGLPMPMAWAPFGNSFEFVADGRFNFHIEIYVPLVWLIVRYRGFLVPIVENH